MHAHTQSHTAASLSVQEQFFLFLFLSFFTLRGFSSFFFVGKEEELFFFPLLNGNRGGDG